MAAKEQGAIKVANPYWSQDNLTLYLGDCLEVMARMEPESVSCVVTDPPYNVGKDFGKGRKADLRDDYNDWLRSVWENCGRLVRTGGFLCYTNRIAHLPIGMAPPQPWRLFHVAVWHKPLALAGCWYSIAPHWEPIIILVKGKPWRPFRSEFVMSDVRDHNVVTDGVAGGHPTVKPVRLMIDLIEFSCPPNGTVLDPFVGTGTTLVAARKLGRQAVGIELSEAYCRQAVRRLTLGDAGVRRQVEARRTGGEQLALEE